MNHDVAEPIMTTQFVQRQPKAWKTKPPTTGPTTGCVKVSWCSMEEEGTYAVHGTYRPDGEGEGAVVVADDVGYGSGGIRDHCCAGDRAEETHHEDLSEVVGQCARDDEDCEQGDCDEIDRSAAVLDSKRYEKDAPSR